jgi:hypothetical protein
MIDAGRYHAWQIAVCSSLTVCSADMGTADHGSPGTDHSISILGCRATRKIFRMGEAEEDESEPTRQWKGKRRHTKGRPSCGITSLDGAGTLTPASSADV